MLVRKKKTIITPKYLLNTYKYMHLYALDKYCFITHCRDCYQHLWFSGVQTTWTTTFTGRIESLTIDHIEQMNTEYVDTFITPNH